ncbi:hypothetical protein M3221_13715 [Domibacillus indicus]|uniref:hypothetical protein n=1 Tax=Domibacillus indicus TaxID=1437523 RepID=UPI00203DBE00|nr:hypothetical protein [Domibacillus indicus]MCM3789458.1 hypothetical protein [Domibacillus indicus]
MNKYEVCQLLVNHHQQTGKEMAVFELIIACGETEPAQLMTRRQMFNWYLDK